MEEFQKELKFEIMVNGEILQGDSVIFVKDGKVDYSYAEQHFYEIMRKWEKDWLQEAQEEEMEFILNDKKNLETLQTHFIGLQEYGGIPIVKDNCEDLFENWLEEQDLDDLKKILK